VRNPQIVAAFRRLGLCEQAGTGIRMVLNQWQALGHLEPEYDNDRSRKTFEIRLPLAKDQVTDQVTEQVTGEVTGEVQKFLKILYTPMSRSEAQIALNLKGQANFRDRYLKTALDLEFVEMTIPDKPRSSKQKYRLTDKGKEWVEQNQAEK
jgi:ATP-dependent DNA helicase RecG